MLYRMLRLSFFSLLFFSLLACEGEKPCPYGTPKAIFAPSMSGVEDHQFEQKGQGALEQLRIPEYDFNLEIQQSGCEQLVQTFRFELLEGKLDPKITAPDCVQLAANLFHGLSQLDPELAFFTGWRDALYQKRMDFEFNTLTDLGQRGYQARIDKIDNPNSVLLIVELVGPKKED